MSYVCFMLKLKHLSNEQYTKKVKTSKISGSVVTHEIKAPCDGWKGGNIRIRKCECNKNSKRRLAVIGAKKLIKNLRQIFLKKRNK